MPRTVKLEPHLSPEELRARYLTSREPGERTRYHALWLIASGKSGRNAALTVGRSVGWASWLTQGYNAFGPAFVLRERQRPSGPQRRLSSDDELILRQALTGKAPDGGLWSGRKVSEWIEARTGARTHPATGWVYLRRLGLSPQVPRPRHPDAAGEAEREILKRGSSSS